MIPGSISQKYEALWQASGVDRYLPVLGQRLDFLVRHIVSPHSGYEYGDYYFNEKEYRASITMEAFSLTEMLAQFCAGGQLWVFADKARFLSPTVDLLKILEVRSRDLVQTTSWLQYRDSVEKGNYDFFTSI